MFQANISSLSKHRLPSRSLLQWSGGQCGCGEVYSKDGGRSCPDQETAPPPASVGRLNSQEPGNETTYTDCTEYIYPFVKITPIPGN